MFDQYFGLPENRKSVTGAVCSVGFEPNPRHAGKLQELQSVYEGCGWQAKFRVKTAAAHAFGMTTFYSENDLTNFEWGGSIVKSVAAHNPTGLTRYINEMSIVSVRSAKNKHWRTNRISNSQQGSWQLS